MDRQVLIEQLFRLLPEDGLQETILDGVTLFRASHRVAPLPGVFPAQICIPLQGAKRAYFDGRVHLYDSSRYLCSSVPLPVQGEVLEASENRPLLGMRVSLETPTVAEVCAIYESEVGSHKLTASETQNFMSVPWDSTFRAAVEQILEALADTVLLKITGEGRLRELVVAVLRGPAGPMILTRSRQHRPLVRVIGYIRSHLDTPLRIDELARLAGMSKAVFHKYFKQATSQTPLQFIKTLRLNEGARLIAHGSPVSSAATQVGYMSPSQFSRDFQRHFGRTAREWLSAAAGDGEPSSF